MQHRALALRASIAKMPRLETHRPLRAQRGQPVDRRARVTLAPSVAAFRARFVPSKATPCVEGIRVSPSMDQAFFAASGLTSLTFAVPAGSGGM